MSSSIWIFSCTQTQVSHVAPLGEDSLIQHSTISLHLNMINLWGWWSPCCAVPCCVFTGSALHELSCLHCVAFCDVWDQIEMIPIPENLLLTGSFPLPKEHNVGLNLCGQKEGLNLWLLLLEWGFQSKGSWTKPEIIFFISLTSSTCHPAEGEDMDIFLEEGVELWVLHLQIIEAHKIQE